MRTVELRIANREFRTKELPTLSCEWGIVNHELPIVNDGIANHRIASGRIAIESFCVGNYSLEIKGDYFLKLILKQK